MRSDAPTNLHRPSATATPTQLVRKCVSACDAMHCDAPTNSTNFRASTPTVGGATGRSLAALRRRHSTSFQLVRLVELVEVLENKPETHHQPGTTSTDRRALPGSSGRNVPANRSCRSVIGTRVRKHPSGKSARPVLAGLSIRSLRGEPAMTLSPAVIFTDPCRHARRHAQERASFGCDNAQPSTCAVCDGWRGWGVWERKTVCTTPTTPLRPLRPAPRPATKLLSDIHP